MVEALRVEAWSAHLMSLCYSWAFDKVLWGGLGRNGTRGRVTIWWGGCPDVPIWHLGPDVPILQNQFKRLVWRKGRRGLRCAYMAEAEHVGVNGWVGRARHMAEPECGEVEGVREKRPRLWMLL